MGQLDDARDDPSLRGAVKALDNPTRAIHA
jgi:hypothetical protein